MFLQARLEKFQSVGCVSWVDSTGLAPKLMKKFSPPPDTSKVLENSLNVSACDASIRNPVEFVPGSVQFCHEFWEKKILVSCPNKLEMLSWIRAQMKCLTGKGCMATTPTLRPTEQGACHIFPLGEV